MNIEQLKTMNLVSFCESCYGMQFQRKGQVFACLSPFKQETNASIFNHKNYCCFVVRNVNGELMCLDNHQIDGSDKFILGSKHVFVLNYDALFRAKEVVITEGIIDLLSMRTLFPVTGLALLGNALDFPAEWIRPGQKLILALDNDDAGDIGKKKLRARFPDNEFEDFTVGDYKDPNEVLIAFPEISTKRKKYSSRKKLEIYQEYQRCQNKSAVTRKFGIDRSYLNEIIHECDDVLLRHFDQKKPGRKKVDAPNDLAEALKQIETLKRQNLELAREKEALYITNEFNKLKISWAEQAGVSVKNRHLKKKKK